MADETTTDKGLVLDESKGDMGLSLGGRYRLLTEKELAIAKQWNGKIERIASDGSIWLSSTEHGDISIKNGEPHGLARVRVQRTKARYKCKRKTEEEEEEEEQERARA